MKRSGAANSEAEAWTIASCLRFAGRAGIDPWNYTLNEIFLMSEGASMAQWEPMSHLLAMTYNRNATHPKDPGYFNPYDFDHPCRKPQDDTLAHKSFHEFICGFAEPASGRKGLKFEELPRPKYDDAGRIIQE